MCGCGAGQIATATAKLLYAAAHKDYRYQTQRERERERSSKTEGTREGNGARALAALHLRFWSGQLQLIANAKLDVKIISLLFF